MKCSSRPGGFTQTASETSITTPRRQRDRFGRVVVQCHPPHIAAILHPQVGLQGVGVRSCACCLGRGTRCHSAARRLGGRQRRCGSSGHRPGGCRQRCWLAVQSRVGQRTPLQGTRPKSSAPRPRALLSAERPSTLSCEDHACKQLGSLARAARSVLGFSQRQALPAAAMMSHRRSKEEPARGGEDRVHHLHCCRGGAAPVAAARVCGPPTGNRMPASQEGFTRLCPPWCTVLRAGRPGCVGEGLAVCGGSSGEALTGGHLKGQVTSLRLILQQALGLLLL